MEIVVVEWKIVLIKREILRDVIEKHSVEPSDTSRIVLYHRRNILPFRNYMSAKY